MVDDTDFTMIDWDYWPYLWLVVVNGELCVKDHNGWLMFSGATMLGLDGVE